MSADGKLSPGRTWWRKVSALGPNLSHPTTGYVLLFMILAGVVLRIQNVGYPLYFGFDEHQYVGAAHQFLVCLPDVGECCHPPLSKLLISLGMLIFGNNPMGWRFMPLCFGLQNLVLAFLIASALFKDRRAGWLAAAFMAADGFHLAYSRAALPDIILASSILWSILAAVTARGWGGVFACAVIVGLAASIKWVGLFVGIPVCLAILLLRRVPWYTLVCFAVVPFVHLLVWMIGLKLIGHPHDPMSVWAEIRNRQNIHLGFAHHTNPIESPWYSWLVMYHPIVIKSAYQGGTARLASSIGNPVLWFALDAVLVGLVATGAAFLARAKAWRQKFSEFFDGDARRAILILGVAWLSIMLLWISGRIVTYWYHYLTPYAIGLTLMGGIVSRLERRFPKGVLVFVLVVLAFSIFLAPVWAELPISTRGAQIRLPFPLWR